MDDYEKKRNYYNQFKGFKDLMFGVKHKMDEDYIINCLEKIELEKLLKDVEKSEIEIEKIREKYFKKE